LPLRAFGNCLKFVHLLAKFFLANLETIIDPTIIATIAATMTFAATKRIIESTEDDCAQKPK